MHSERDRYSYALRPLIRPRRQGVVARVKCEHCEETFPVWWKAGGVRYGWRDLADIHVRVAHRGRLS